MTRRQLCVAMCCLLLTLPLTMLACTRQYDLARYGVRPNTGADMAPKIAQALQRIAREVREGDSVVISLRAGRYDIYPDNAQRRTYYISNHDQPNPKAVGIVLEGWHNLTLEGNGADIICHGRMLPLALVESTNCNISNLAIDFETPHITQVTIVENDSEAGTITYRPAPWVQWSVEDGRFVSRGEGWQMVPVAGIAFDSETRHVVYRTSDIWVGTSNVEAVGNSLVRAPWRDARLTPGTVVAMRDWSRPAPGIFMYHNVNTTLSNVRVHYAEGMGLLAQMCEDITLNGFAVCLRGDDDPRYFTTQADATHFSGCRGHIASTDGLYEGMMDDAINIHGTYLKVTERLDERTVVARYMHEQTYGFEWGREGDEVQFVSSRTMELTGEQNVVSAICAHDSESTDGCKAFRITFANALPEDITPEASIGIENLTWTPTVYFARNTIRNNRARGALFSTPGRVVVEHNLFDHTSGTAILLCGDCNGWYETGACRDVTIRHNRFVNALTNQFQFTNAVISIYPEIPELERQERYFHSGIVIEDNMFETFDKPLLYAKSVNGLIYRNNRVVRNHDFPAYHPIQQEVTLDRVTNAVIR